MESREGLIVLLTWETKRKKKQGKERQSGREMEGDPERRRDGVMSPRDELEEKWSGLL